MALLLHLLQLVLSHLFADASIAALNHIAIRGTSYARRVRQIAIVRRLAQHFQRGLFRFEALCFTHLPVPFRSQIQLLLLHDVHHFVAIFEIFGRRRLQHSFEQIKVSAAHFI